MKNSPSAFIPFCEFNGDMLAVGEYIDSFPFPVCNAFRPSVLHGQLCYQFDPSTVLTNLTTDQPFLMFIMDYNEDREYNTHVDEEDEQNENPQKLDEMDKNDANNNEALIYIHTLGNQLIYSLDKTKIYFCSSSKSVWRRSIFYILCE